MSNLFWVVIGIVCVFLGANWYVEVGRDQDKAEVKRLLKDQKQNDKFRTQQMAKRRRYSSVGYVPPKHYDVLYLRTPRRPR